jgi:hypothetical protein
MEITNFEEEVQAFDLKYMTFGVPRKNEGEKECECCPNLKRRFTKGTKIHGPYFCSHKDCEISVCGDCVVCYHHSYYKCPGCDQNTYWKECIFRDIELYNLASEREWKFVQHFPDFDIYPWFDEVLVSCNRCFQKVLFDEAVERSNQNTETSGSKERKRKVSLSKETEKHVKHVKTSIQPFKNKK